MNCNFFISLDAERSDGILGSWWDGFLSCQIFKNFRGCMMYVVPLVSLSPDSPTEMLRTNFSILIYLMGFSFSAFFAGFVATFFDMWEKIISIKYYLSIFNYFFMSNSPTSTAQLKHQNLLTKDHFWSFGLQKRMIILSINIYYFDVIRARWEKDGCQKERFLC